MTSKVVAGFGAAFLVFSVAASAQGLGDLAKQEEARRKTVTTPGKVYTNESLRPAPKPSSPTSSTGAAAATSASTSTPDASAGSSDTASAANGAGNEAAWKRKMTDARTALDRSQSFADALQTRINSLTTDFTNRDDPAQRSQIAADRDKALAQLTQLKKEIEDNTKAIQNIQEDARKAGVPAGWVR